MAAKVMAAVRVMGTRAYTRELLSSKDHPIVEIVCVPRMDICIEVTFCGYTVYPERSAFVQKRYTIRMTYYDWVERLVALTVPATSMTPLQNSC